jgi:hypothetical protein
MYTEVTFSFPEFVVSRSHFKSFRNFFRNLRSQGHILRGEWEKVDEGSYCFFVVAACMYLLLPTYLPSALKIQGPILRSRYMRKAPEFTTQQKILCQITLHSLSCDFSGRRSGSTISFFWSQHHSTKDELSWPNEVLEWGGSSNICIN